MQFVAFDRRGTMLIGSRFGRFEDANAGLTVASVTSTTRAGPTSPRRPATIDAIAALSVLAHRQSSAYSYVTVTQRTRTKRCKWCGAAFTIGTRVGRPPEYCRRSHRQRHYEAKRLGNLRGLSGAELMMSVDDYERLRDAVYVMEAALEDVDIDLRGKPTRSEYAAAVAHLADAATAVIAASPEPTAIGE